MSLIWASASGGASHTPWRPTASLARRASSPPLALRWFTTIASVLRRTDNPQSQAVERHCLRAADLRGLKAFLNLTRRLFVERQTDDPVRRDPAATQLQNALDQNRRLAAAGRRDHLDHAGAGVHGLCLSGIEPRLTRRDRRHLLRMLGLHQPLKALQRVGVPILGLDEGFLVKVIQRQVSDDDQIEPEPGGRLHDEPEQVRQGIGPIEHDIDDREPVDRSEPVKPRLRRTRERPTLHIPASRSFATQNLRSHVQSTCV